MADLTLTVDELHEVRRGLYDLKFESERHLQSTAPARDPLHDECCKTAKARAEWRATEHATFKAQNAAIVGAIEKVDAALTECEAKSHG